MKLEDLGIEPGTGHHSSQLTRPENIFVGLLWVDHVGEENAIGADELSIRFKAGLNVWPLDEDRLKVRLKSMQQSDYGRRELAQWKRDVRWMHNHLLRQHDHIPVLSKAGPGGGYWIAESEAELDAFYNAFRQRGLTGLVKASRGKKAVLVDMVRQLSFDFALEDKTDLAPVRPGAGVSMPVAVVDQFLERMLARPEEFAGDLRRLSDKFGHVLFSKYRHQAVRRKVRELAELLNA